MKFNKWTIGLAAVLSLAININAHAGLQAQIDSSTNLLAASSTNIYALYGDATGIYTNGSSLSSPNSFIDMSKSDVASISVGGYFASTGGVATNVTFQIYESVDLKLWSLSTNLVVSVPAMSTNWAFATWKVSQGGIGNGPAAAYALRAVQNPSGTVTTPGIGSATNQASLFFKAFTRTGF